MATITLQHRAMASHFEITLRGEDEIRLHAAAEEACREVDRIEELLSFYSPTSEISRINRSAANGPVRVTRTVFRVLKQAQAVYEETAGAFDVTIGPLMRAWGFVNADGRIPDEEALNEARRLIGMDKVILDADRMTVEYTRPGVSVDLGAIGKGFAIDEARITLEESGITDALLHGGTSTILGLGTPADDDSWKIGIRHPGADPQDPQPEDIVCIVPLSNESLSVSTVWGKSFTHEGRDYGHVIDPRTGRPVLGAVLGAVVCDSAVRADAYSTGLLTLGPESSNFLTNRPSLRAIVFLPEEQPGIFGVINQGLVTSASSGSDSHHSLA